MKNKSKLKNILTILMVIFMFASITACGNKSIVYNNKITEYEENEKKSSEIKIHFIDVGQADSILIEQEDSYMIIDGGNNADAELIEEYLKQNGVKKLEYVVATHPHEDHIGGLDNIIKEFNVEKILMPNVTHTTRTYRDVITAAKDKNVNIRSPKSGEKYDIGKAFFTIIGPNSKEYDDLNNYSIVLRLSFGNKNFIFTGDAETISEKEIINMNINIKSDVLKVGHHGSHSSTSIGFLNKIDPKYAVISCGKDNDYGHPHKETMELLKSQKIKVYRTDESGNIIITSDGEDISFNVKEGSYSYLNDKDKDSSNIDYNTQNNNVIISKLNKIDEVITIKNNSKNDINLKDWRIVSKTGNQQYVFPKYILKAGDSVSVSSGKKSTQLKWGKTNVWNNNSSDPAEIFDNNNNLVYRYND